MSFAVQLTDDAAGDPEETHDYLFRQEIDADFQRVKRELVAMLQEMTG